VDPEIYGGGKLKHAVAGWFERFLMSWQDDLIAAISKYPQFRAPQRFDKTKEMVKGLCRLRQQNGRGLAADRRND